VRGDRCRWRGRFLWNGDTVSENAASLVSPKDIVDDPTLSRHQKESALGDWLFDALGMTPDQRAAFWRRIGAA
jgi:hypothetical protein